MKIVIFVLVAWKQEHSLQLALCAAEELLCETQHKYSEWGLGSSFSSQAASWPWSIVVAGTAGEVCEGNTNITILLDYSNKDTCILMSVTDMRTLQVRYWMLRLQTRQSLDSQIHCVLHSQLFFFSPTLHPVLPQSQPTCNYQFLSTQDNNVLLTLVQLLNNHDIVSVFWFGHRHLMKHPPGIPESISTFPESTSTM